MRAMNFEVFERRFKPRDAVAMGCGDFGDYMVDRETARQYPDEHVWTVLDCDGRLYLAAGWHFVNRTGEYVITEVPHDFTHRDVLYA